MPRPGTAAALLMAACTAGVGADGPREEDRVRHPLGFPASAVVLADVDGDGSLEVVVAGGDSVGVLRVAPAGRGVEGASAWAGPEATGVAAGDVDGDGWTDLVVANHETDHVTLLPGGADGFHGRGARRVPVDVAPHPHAVALADVDGDGALDLLVDHREAGALRLLRGGGDRTFSAAGLVDVEGDPYVGMVVQDVDGDGRLDVVTPGPRAVVLRRGGGGGAFEAWTRLQAPGLAPFSVAVGDVDGDGRADVVAGGGEGEGTVAAWLADGAGGFRPAPGSPWSVPRGPVTVAVGDVDGDGAADVAATSYLGDAVTLFTGRPPFRTHTVDVPGAPWGVAVGDVDGDGAGDVVTVTEMAPGLTVLLGPR